MDAASEKTRQRAIQALRERIERLRRRGWTPQERRAYCGQEPAVAVEIAECERLIRVIEGVVDE